MDPDGRNWLDTFSNTFSSLFQFDFGMSPEEAVQTGLQEGVDTLQSLEVDVGVSGTFGAMTGSVGLRGITVGLEAKPDIGAGLYISVMQKGDPSPVTTATYGRRHLGVQSSVSNRGNWGFGA